MGSAHAVVMGVASVATRLGNSALVAVTPMATPPHASPDYALFRLINSMAGHNAALDGIMVGFAKYSPEFFAIVLLVLWLTWKPANQRGAFLAGSAGLVALGIGQLIGMLFPRPRPYLVHKVTLLITHAADTSFPSDHATLGFAIAAMLYQFNRGAATLVLLTAIGMAFARVFVGAHYPTDVLGGAVLGTVTSITLGSLTNRAPFSSWLDKLMKTMARWHFAARPVG